MGIEELLGYWLCQVRERIRIFRNDGVKHPCLTYSMSSAGKREYCRFFTLKADQESVPDTRPHVLGGDARARPKLGPHGASGFIARYTLKCSAGTQAQPKMGPHGRVRHPCLPHCVSSARKCKFCRFIGLKAGQASLLDTFSSARGMHEHGLKWYAWPCQVCVEVVKGGQEREVNTCSNYE